jgi:hypothetical protein
MNPTMNPTTRIHGYAPAPSQSDLRGLVVVCAKDRGGPCDGMWEGGAGMGRWPV